MVHAIPRFPFKRFPGPALLRVLLAVAAVAGQAGIARAQGAPSITPADVPTSADPAHVNEDLRNRLKMPPDAMLPSVSGGGVAPAPAPAGADQYRFVLTSLTLRGGTVYENRDLLAAANIQVGREISVQDLFDMAARLTATYQRDGYTLSRVVVPEQEIDGGAVTLDIVEGYVSTLDIDAPAGLLFQAAAVRNAVLDVRPFNIRRLERALIALNARPDLAASVIIRPVAENALPGAVGMTLSLREKDRPIRVVADNYGSVFVGPWQYGVTYPLPMFDGRVGYGDMTLFTTQQSQELRFASINHTLPLGVSGFVLNAAATYARSLPGRSLDFIDIKSKYKSLAMDVEYPVLLRRGAEVAARIGAEVKDIDSDVLTARLYHDSLRIVKAGIRASWTESRGASNRMDLSIAHGLDILGARNSGASSLSRAEGRSDFTTALLEIDRTQPLWRSLTLRTRLSAQYSGTPLLSSEEFGFGGSDIGRGYDNSEITGDSGIALAAELAWQNLIVSPRLRMEPFAFFDIGRVWNRDQGQDPMSGSSLGLGARAYWLDNTVLTLMLARPLTRPQQNPQYGKGYDPRLMVRLDTRF